MAPGLAANGTTKIAHTGFLLLLVHEVKALVGFLMVGMVKLGRIGKKPPDTSNLKSILYTQSGDAKGERGTSLL